MSIEAVIQPRFILLSTPCYVSFGAEVLIAFLVFGDTSRTFNLGFMVLVHIDLGSDRPRLAGSTGHFPRSFTSFLLTCNTNVIYIITSIFIVLINNKFHQHPIEKRHIWSGIHKTCELCARNQHTFWRKLAKLQGFELCKRMHIL